MREVLATLVLLAVGGLLCFSLWLWWVTLEHVGIL